nr:HD domain-containing protein [Saprospiraceae bacterium]
MRFEALKKYFLRRLEKQLSPKLTYHGIHHTLDVLNVCEDYITRYKLSTGDAELLLVGAVLHDSGFLETYKAHEEKGVQLAESTMPYFEYTEKEIEVVSGLIMATKVPQQPTTLLEKIICDADLDYLGRSDFYEIGETLFIELQHFIGLTDRTEWNKIQIKFLTGHEYHTDWAREVRAPVKNNYIEEIKMLV